MNKDQQPDAENQSEQESRRKIIKGLVGLPAVLTVGPASAAPIASAFECAVAPADGGRNHLDVTVVTDFTDKLAFPDVQVKDSTNRNCVNESRPGLVSPPGGAPHLTGYYDNGYGSPVRLGGFGPDADRACVVFVDSNGNIKYQYDGSNLPVAASCLVSVNPTIGGLP